MSTTNTYLPYSVCLKDGLLGFGGRYGPLTAIVVGGGHKTGLGSIKQCKQLCDDCYGSLSATQAARRQFVDWHRLGLMGLVDIW